MASNLQRIALIGLGEVGGIMAEDLLGLGGYELSAFDLKFADAASPPSHTAKRLQIPPSESAAAAMREADLIVCAVTAAQDVEAARAAGAGMKRGAFYIDFNSASPESKRAAAQAIEAVGGRYVEAAVMASFPPRRIGTPMLLGGPHAEAFLAVAPAGMNARVYDVVLGRASAVKMCRSVLVKGMEALLSESLLAARRYGVEHDVLGSLGDMLPHPDWEAQARYMISRALLHGKRRAEEMREVARTVREAGVEPLMSLACAERQDWAAQIAASEQAPDASAAPLTPFLQSFLSAVDAEADRTAGAA